MKCQACEQTATLHVTELVAGGPVEYHVCEAHSHDLEGLKPAVNPPLSGARFSRLFADPKFLEALRDPLARQKLAAHLLPALCLALADDNPAVRIAAAFRLAFLGSDARSTLGALRDALDDPHEHVRKYAQIAIDYIESGHPSRWFL